MSKIAGSGAVRKLLALQARVLCLRTTRGEVDAARPHVLLWGAFATWLVGVGRWWDSADAGLAQKLGLASLGYVLVLALLLAVFSAPLTPRGDWRGSFLSSCATHYVRVLTVVMLTALPGLLYAIPVERFLPMETAQACNFGFLLIVASWRVTIWAVLLRSVLGISDVARRTLSVLTPISLVVFALVILRLQRGVFMLMSGMRDEVSRVQDVADSFLVTLTLGSVVVFPVSLFCWTVAVSVRFSK